MEGRDTVTGASRYMPEDMPLPPYVQYNIPRYNIEIHTIKMMGDECGWGGCERERARR